MTTKMARLRRIEARLISPHLPPVSWGGWGEADVSREGAYVLPKRG